MVYMLLWLYVVIDTFIQVTASYYCQCNPMADHPQNHYCNADFVLKATILDKQLVMNLQLDDMFASTKYTVEVHMIYRYKSPNVTLASDIHTIWTPPSCPAFFPVTATHIILGSIKEGYLETTYCHWNPVYLGLSVEQEHGFYKTYGRNCRCKIKFCEHDPATGLCPHNPKRHCVVRWDFPYSFIGQCYIRYSYCNRKNRQCEFMEDYVTRDCVTYQRYVVEEFEKVEEGDQESSGESSGLWQEVGSSLDD